MLPFQFDLHTESLNSSVARTVECTSSVLQALVLFGDFNSDYRCKEIKENVNKAAIYIENNQHKDGSWFVRKHLLF
jgi:squalene cyclase